MAGNAVRRPPVCHSPVSVSVCHGRVCASVCYGQVCATAQCMLRLSVCQCVPWFSVCHGPVCARPSVCQCVSVCAMAQRVPWASICHGPWRSSHTRSSTGLSTGPHVCARARARAEVCARTFRASLRLTSSAFQSTHLSRWKRCSSTAAVLAGLGLQHTRHRA